MGEWDTEMVAVTESGATVPMNWSVDDRVRGVDPSDRAYLLRQGSHGRGLVATGEITSAPRTGQSWRDGSTTTQYLNLE